MWFYLSRRCHPEVWSWRSFRCKSSSNYQLRILLIHLIHLQMYKFGASNTQSISSSTTISSVQAPVDSFRSSSNAYTDIFQTMSTSPILSTTSSSVSSSQEINVRDSTLYNLDSLLTCCRARLPQQVYC